MTSPPPLHDAAALDDVGPLHDAGRPTLMQLILPYWTSERRWKALAALVLIVSVISGTVYLHVWANLLLGDVTDALVGRKWDLLRHALMLSVAVGVGGAIIGLSNAALQSLLELSWRSWLTDHLLASWTGDHAYYDIEREGLLSNADQRIAEDVRLFVHALLIMGLNVVGVLINTVTFSVVLWELSGSLSFTVGGFAISIPGYMVLLAFAYSIGSFALAHWTGKALVGLNMRKQTVEGDFRYGAMQLRENAEQIAFYDGGAQEALRLRTRFQAIRDNTRAIIVTKFKLGLTQNVYGNLLSFLPTLAILPRYLLGQITLGGITRNIAAYHSLNDALSYFTTIYADLTEMLAVANRLRDLLWALDKARRRSGGLVRCERAQAVLSSGPLRLHTPLGRLLAVLEPLRIAPGQRWMLRGASGTGKSTVLRAVAGLWPYGVGTIALPAGARLMFLPQRSYIPSGTIKAAVCYPGEAADFDDARCREALLLCGLTARANTLGAVDNWQQTLSGGEQQRLAFARVILQRPDFVFLDEATSALDSVSEVRLYQTMIEQLPGSAVVSVAHRAALSAFHDHMLELSPAPVVAVA